MVTMIAELVWVIPVIRRVERRIGAVEEYVWPADCVAQMIQLWQAAARDAGLQSAFTRSVSRSGSASGIPGRGRHCAGG